jgi:hypothetical protein
MPAYMDELINDVNDRGLGVPAPPVAPSVESTGRYGVGANGQSNWGPGGIDLSGWNNRLSPALQSVLNKIMGSSTSPNQRDTLANVFGSVARMEEQGMRGGQTLAEQGMKGQATLAERTLAETGADRRLGMTIPAELKKTTVATEPHMITAKAATTPIPGSGRMVGMGGAGGEPVDEFASHYKALTDFLRRK